LNTFFYFFYFFIFFENKWRTIALKGTEIQAKLEARNEEMKKCLNTFRRLNLDEGGSLTISQ